VIAGNNLVALLHALATDHADRALNIVVSEPDVAEGLRQALYAAIANKGSDGDVKVACCSQAYTELLKAESH